MTQQWPPPLPDHVVLKPWRPMHPADLAELRERVGLGPCEGIECEARHLETGKREIVLQLRPLPAAPVRDDVARARLDEGPLPLPGVRQIAIGAAAYPACTNADFEVPVLPVPPAEAAEGRWVGTPPRAGKSEAMRRAAASGGGGRAR